MSINQCFEKPVPLVDEPVIVGKPYEQWRSCIGLDGRALLAHCIQFNHDKDGNLLTSRGAGDGHSDQVKDKVRAKVVGGYIIA